MNRLGLGTENVVKVRTDSSGRMIPEELESEIRKSVGEGKTPMMVNATAGTTVCGAYDDLVNFKITNKLGVTGTWDLYYKFFTAVIVAVL
jgi:glutamate/tyrosine decarboxylase-like PLP-dependent enzyme